MRLYSDSNLRGLVMDLSSHYRVRLFTLANIRLLAAKQLAQAGAGFVQLLTSSQSRKCESECLGLQFSSTVIRTLAQQ